jgi:hypothetical protein
MVRKPNAELLYIEKREMSEQRNIQYRQNKAKGPISDDATLPFKYGCSPSDVRLFSSSSNSQRCSQSIKIAPNEISTLELELNEYEAQAENRDFAMFCRLAKSRSIPIYSNSAENGHDLSARLGQFEQPPARKTTTSDVDYPRHQCWRDDSLQHKPLHNQASLASLLMHGRVTAVNAISPGFGIEATGYDEDDIFELDL